MKASQTTTAKAPAVDAGATNPRAKRAPRAKRTNRPKPLPQNNVVTPDGKTVALSMVQPGDCLGVYNVTSGASSAPVQVTPAPIIGWARTSTGISLYLPGATSASFRSALEDEKGLIEECFFTVTTPTSLCEVAIQDHSVGELIYYPASSTHVISSTIRS